MRSASPPAPMSGKTRAATMYEDHLEEDHRERQEVPVGSLAKVEARPPRLRRKEQDEDAPDEGRIGEPHPAASEEERPVALEDLGDRKAEDDREKDRQIAEGVHHYTSPLMRWA